MSIAVIIAIDLFFYLHLYYCKETHLYRVSHLLVVSAAKLRPSATFRFARPAYILYL